MNDGTKSPGNIDLRAIFAATTVVVGMVTAAAVSYLLRSFARLTQDLADLAPQLYQGTLGARPASSNSPRIS